MRLVQARLTEDEYELLRQRAREERKPMKLVIREALRAHLLPVRVDPTDPLFSIFPLAKGRGRTHRLSQTHDEELYPAAR